jgi:ATP-dependent Clp protease ATP-binding subunit ClpA
LTNSLAVYGEEGVGKSALILGLLNKIALEDVAPALLAKHVYIFDQFEFFKLSPPDQVSQFDAAMEYLSPKPILPAANAAAAVTAAATALVAPNSTATTMAPTDQPAQKSSLIFIDRLDDFVANCGPDRARRLIGGSLINALENAPVNAFITAQSRNRALIEQTSTLFSRIFKPKIIEERTPQQTLNILRQMVPRFERNHKVIIGDDAISELVRLGIFFEGRLPGQNPTKLIEFMDQLAASVNNARYGKSMELLNLEMREAELLAEEEELLKSVKPNAKKLEVVRQAKKDVREELGPKLAEWNKQNGEIRKIRKDLLEAEAFKAPPQEKIERYVKWQTREKDRVALARQTGAETPAEPPPATPTQQDRDDRDKWDRLANAARTKLASLETTMFAKPPQVTVEDVRARWKKVTGTSAEATTAAKAAQLMNIEHDLGNTVFGLDEAKSSLANLYRTQQAGISDPSRPIGVVFFTGKTGCGKTELTEQFARLLGIPLIYYNMSLYTSSASASFIMGSAPGLVGFGATKTLPDAVREQPKSIVFLDELEKAHPEVQRLFMQPADKGVMPDSQGLPVFFKDVIFVIATNVLSQTDFTPEERQNDQIVREKLKAAVNPETHQPYFQPAFIGRLDDVLVLDDMTANIADLVMHKEVRQINEGLGSHGYKVTMADAVANEIIKDYFDPTQGGRSLRQLGRKVIRPLVTQRLFVRQLAEQPDEDGELKSMVLGLDGRRITLDGFTLNSAKHTAEDTVTGPGRPTAVPPVAEFKGAAAQL